MDETMVKIDHMTVSAAKFLGEQAAMLRFALAGRLGDLLKVGGPLAAASRELADALAEFEEQADALLMKNAFSTTAEWPEISSTEEKDA